jgi:hypothetical protein
MPLWLHRYHLVATVGGGFAGLASILAVLLSSWAQVSVFSVIIYLILSLVCIWSILLGLRLAEGADLRPELRAFYLLQIPCFTSPLLSYQVGFGLIFYLGTLQNGNNFQFNLGGSWNLGLLTGNRFTLAINLVPVALLWVLRRSNPSLERP